MLTMDQQSTASFKGNSESQRFGEYPRELCVDKSSSDVDNRDTLNGVDMGKTQGVSSRVGYCCKFWVIAGTVCLCYMDHITLI